MQEKLFTPAYRPPAGTIHTVGMHYADMRIRQLRRERKKVSQVVMAADLNTTQATISRMERGEQNASLEKLADVAAYLGVTIPELFVLPEKPEPVRRLEELLYRCTDEQQQALLTLLEAASSQPDDVSGSEPTR